MSTPTRRNVLMGGAHWLAASLLPASLPALANTSRITATDLGGLWLLQGAGCNVVALPGREGALLVDGGLEAHSADLVNAVIAATGSRRVHMLVNTHWHPEQTGSNVLLGEQGSVIFAHEKTRLWLGRSVKAKWFEGTFGPLPARAQPNRTTRSDGTLETDGREVDYGYLPQAHTDGDLFLHFRDTNVLVASGPVAGNGWPLIDFHNGGWLGGLLKAHEKLLGVTSDNTRVVSAHGDTLLARSDLERHHAMYLEIYERLMTALNKGMGPDDVIDAGAAREYEAEMGDSAAFLDAAFRSLLLAYSPD